MPHDDVKETEILKPFARLVSHEKNCNYMPSVQRHSPRTKQSPLQVVWTKGRRPFQATEPQPLNQGEAAHSTTNVVRG